MKATVDDLASVPEHLRGEYEEQDGKFVLKLEDGPSDNGGGDKLKSALDSERKRRSALEKSLNDMKRQFGDLDPESARNAMKTLAELQEKDLLGEGKFDEAVTKRVERLRQDFELREKAMSEEKSGLNSRLESLLIDNALRTAASKAGVIPTAVDDTVLLGKTVFRLKDGEPTPMDGDEVMIGKTGQTLTIDEWISERTNDRPQWFGQSSGGGAPGSVTQNGSVTTISREQAKDVAAYRAAREQAEKAGTKLEIQ